MRNLNYSKILIETNLIGNHAEKQSFTRFPIERLKNSNNPVKWKNTNLGHFWPEQIDHP